MSNRIKILIILGIVLIIGIVVYFLSVRKEAPTVPGAIKSPIQNPETARTQIGNIKYVGSTITVPEKLGVYVNTGTTIDELAAELATRLNLIQSSFNKKVWLSADKKEILSLDSFNNNIEYAIDQSGVKKEPRPNLNESKKRALEFLSSIGLSSTISQEPEIINYYKGDQLAPASSEEAEVIQILFKQGLAGYPLVIETSVFSDIIIFTGTDNKVIKAIFPQRLTPSVKKGDLMTISFQDATSAIEGKDGVIIDVRSESGEKLANITEVDDIILSSTILEYRLSVGDNLFYPYYRFEGTGTLKEGQSVTITIVYPAFRIP